MPPAMCGTAPAAEADGIAHPERLAALDRIRELLTRDRERVQRLLTQVCTYRAAEYEIAAARATLDGAAREIATHRPGAVKRAAVFMPSNVLLYSYILYLLVPSLFTDRITFRPSSRVTQETLALHELLAPVHQLPIVPTTASQRTFLRTEVSTADVVVFTGTYRNAEQIRHQLGHHQLLLYLGGGINPFIVAPGADLVHAARDAVAIRLLNSGQDCLAPDLFYVPQDDRDTFVRLLVGLLEKARFGPYSDPDADFGPILYDDALERAATYLVRHQPWLVYGGLVDFLRRRVDPAVLVLPWQDQVEHIEVFAPIFTIIGYPDEARLAKTLGTGAFAERAMGASVYGRSPDLVAVLRERHMVTADATLLSIDKGNQPFGGRGPMAGYVACQGRLHAEPVLVSKAVADYLTGSDGERPR